MFDWEFANVDFLWGLLIILVLVFWYIWKYWGRQVSFGFSAMSLIGKTRGFSSYLVHAAFGLRLIPSEQRQLARCDHRRNRHRVGH
jgi:hypothetical protein